MVKKFFASLILTFLILLPSFCTTVKTGSVKYQDYGSNRKESILVLPVDNNYFTPYASTYSSIINTMGSDIVNTLNQRSRFKAMPMDEFNYNVKKNRLEPELKQVMNDYKAKGVIDYRNLGIICNALGAKNILLISGDFNSFKFAIQPHPQKSVDLLEPTLIKPAYSIDTLVSLIDPENQSIIWEQTYNKSFNVDSPQTDFEHNAISLKSMRRFSISTANNVLLNINMILEPPEAITNVKSEIIQSNPNNFTTDGVTTTDGHSFSVTNKLVRPIKQRISN